MPLPDDIQWSLFCYYEQSADYARAEAALVDLSCRPGVYADLRPEMIAFYERLLILPPAELAQIHPVTGFHFAREQVQEKLDKVRLHDSA